MARRARSTKNTRRRTERSRGSCHVELRPLESIRPYTANPRKNDQAVKAVARSIQRFGFRQPIVVDGDGVIIAGHTRYKAAKQLALKQVPVHVATDLSPEQIKAYRIVDNQTGTLSDWDYDRLIAEVSQIDKTEYDLDDLGFSRRKLKDLIRASGQLHESEVEPELAPTWQVVVECTSERQQRKLYDRFRKEGLQCRLLTL